MSMTEEQELFFEAVAADKKLSMRNKIYWLLECCRDYWRIIEAAENVRRCYVNIETRHETMPAAMHALDVALRKSDAK
jgi:hypothetical protein